MTGRLRGHRTGSALLVLGALGLAEDAAALAAALADPEPRVHYAAMHALAGFPGRGFAERHGWRGREEEPDPWIGILHPLKGFRNPAAIPPVAAMLDGADGSGAPMAARALAGLTGQPWGEDVEAAKAWWAAHKREYEKGGAKTQER